MLWYANNTKHVAGAEDHLRCCGGFIGCLKNTQVAFVATLVGYGAKSVVMATGVD